MKDMVFLRLDVEGMKRHMVHAFMDHSKEIEGEIERACDRFVSSGELKRQIEGALNQAITEAVKSYFDYGPGFTAVRESVEKMFKGNEKK